MNDEFYDLLQNEENMDLLDEILDWIDAGIEDALEVEAIMLKIEDLDDLGEEDLADQLRTQMEYM
jgi:hypothetical protein